MNISYILWTIGKILFIEGVLLLPCAGVGLCYGEGREALIYALCALGLILIGSLSFVFKPKNQTVRAREGLAIAGLAWTAVSLFGALPLTVTGEADYLDAVFEIVSGFTTTGATIFSHIESLCHATVFWRSFTHWIGGMGVLVFVMAILSLGKNQSMHIMRAEVPGPQAGKLVSKMQANSRILYLIYIALTLIEFTLLLFGGMDAFDSIVHTFGTAGTGGFSSRTLSVGYYTSPYIQYVITAFMLMFSINFNLYYFIVIGNVRQALKSEELKWFFGFVAAATATVTVNIISIYGGLEKAFRYASFSVASVISTTGFATADFDKWPELSRTILVILMFVGAMSGSTGGGIKVSRAAVLIKGAYSTLKKQISPRSVQQVKFEGKLEDDSVGSGVLGYIAVYLCVFAASLIIVSADKFSFTGSFTAVTACFNNVGPGLAEVGPSGNYAGFTALSKITLIFDMLAGRLELFPMLALFTPLAWRKK